MTELTQAGDPAWLREAARFNGLQEIIGSRHEPEIVGFFRDAGFAGVKDDETAWCAAFVGSMLARSGYNPSGSLLARSYLEYGVEATNPQRGDIAVFQRGSSSWQGHVAFFLGFEGQYVVVMGGNQSNAVTVARYAKNKLLGIRRPTDADRVQATPRPPVTPTGGRFATDLVEAVQTALRDKGYHSVGMIDGDYGTNTRGAIMAFQVDNGLPADGRPSGTLLEAILASQPKPVGLTRSVGVPEDSRIVEAANKNIAIGVGTAATGAIAVGREAIEQAQGGVELLRQVQTLLGPVASLFADLWPFLLLALAIGIIWFALQAKRARIEDHRTGKTA